MLPPKNMANRQLPQEAGISEAPLNKGRAEACGNGQRLMLKTLDIAKRLNIEYIRA